MAYTADDLRKMRERGTTRASSSDSKRKYTADDLMAMRGKSAQNETTSLYDSYAKQAVSNTPKYRYNSLEQYDTALKESKPKNDFAKRVANAGINALNALSGIGLTGTGATPIKNLPYNKEEMAYNDLKKERNLYAQEHAFDEYKKYQNEADYAKKSQESIEDYLKILDSNNTDQTYSRVYNAMTDEEKAMANYLASNNINMSLQESNRFKDYMMNMRALVDKRSYDEKVANANKEAEDFGGKIGLSAKSVGENLVSSVGTGGEYLASYLGGWTPNPYGGASGLGNLAMAEREAVSKDMGEVGSFIYNTGMSVADSALGAKLFGKGYSVLMGTNAFNTSYKDLYERGASRDEILLGALTAGAAETVFEKISFENLLKPRGIKDIQAFAKAWLEQAGVEASEEFFTEMTNVITDELTQGANSEVSQMIYQMRNEGRPEDEIQKAVANILAKRVGEAALGGFLSGGAMGGMFIGSQYAQNRRIGRNTDREELSQALENINPESDVAKEYRGKDLTNLKDTEVGALVMDAYAQADKDARAKYQNAVRDSLENLGLSEGEIKDYYDAIFAEKPTKVQKLLRENETIKDIMRDVNTRVLPEIDESARQNKYDIAKTVSNRQGVAKALKKSDLKVGAVTELNGEEVKVTDVIKNGDKITVVTNKGEADPAQLTLSAKDANLVMIASGMENNTMRKAYLNNYHGQNVAEYTDSFSTAYSYGKNGVTEETLLEDIGQTINLSIEDATNIYQQGASEIKKSSNEVVETAEEIKKITKDFRKGNFDDSKIDKKKLSASQRGAYALAQLWTDLGINVSLFNDTSEDSENGYYKDGTVYINLSARYTKQNLKFDRGYVINTMAHELTHWMEDTDSEAFKALKTAIFNYYGEEKTNRLVAQEQQRYEKNKNKTMSKKAAESEVIARACEDMLSDSDTIERILMGVNADTRNTIVTKIREFIDRLGEFLNKILHGNMSPSEASRMLRENAEVFEQVRQQWIKTFTEAVNKIQEVENAYNDVTEDYTKTESKQFSLKATTESTDKLMALHNVHQSDLLKTLKLGGFACPSIAILKQYMPHNEFGDISIVFPKATINPKLRWNSVFSGDAYTPIFPTVEKKLSRDKQYAIEEKVRNLVGGDEMFRIIGSPSLDYDNMTDKLNRFETAADAYRYTDEMKYAYLKDIGKDVSIPTKDYVYMPNEISNDAIGAIALVLGKDIVKEMYEGGSTWYNNHSEEVDKLRLRLNEAFIKEHNAGEYKSASLKELYHNYFNDEDGKLSFRNYDTIVRAMYAMTTNGVRQVKDSVALKKMLDENIEQEAFDKWLNDLFEGVVEKEGFRNDVDLFTASGKRRSWEALHDEITLENVVKYMRKQEPSGIGMMGANIFGGATKKYASIEDMRKDIARLMIISEDEMDKKRTEISNKTHDLIYEVVGNTGDAFSLSMRHDDVYKMFVEAIRKYRTVEGINSYLHKEGDGYYNIMDDVAPKLLEIVKEIEQLPTGYFEAKPLRGVSLDEIAYVVIPDNSSEDLIKALDENGIQHYTYDHESEDNRAEVTNEHADVESGTLFSSKVDSEGRELTEEQQEFFAKSEIRYSDKIEGSTTEQKISDILQNKYNIGEKEANNEAKGLREIIRRASNNSGRRSGISSVSDKETVALGITTEFVNFGKIDWRGRKLNYDNEKGAYELASYAMLLRNPAYETSRIFYTKGDAIIANDAYTTRLSDATKISDKATNKDAFDDISKKMSRYGADGFYMMHNHPSGSVKPSKLDVETTKLYGNIKGFRGHIVIDHNKYSLIDKSGTYVTADISDGKAIDYNKRVVDHPLLYSKISNADDVGRIAAAITHSPNYSVVLYASSSAEIRMIEAVHDNFVQSKGFEGYIANNKSKIGASWAFLCTENVDVYNKSTLKDLYTRTIFKDVVNYQTFNSYMSDGLNQDPSYAGNGKKLNDTKVYKVSDAESTYYSIKDDGFEEKDSKTLGLTDERIDKLLSGGYYGSTQQNYAQAYITYMSPDDFLKLTTGKNQRALEDIKDWQNNEWNDTERPAFSMEEFANTYDYQPIQLNIDEENHEVIGHEGRHRMWQIKQLGYNRVPVLLFNYDNKYTKTPIVGMDLMPQWFSEKDDSLNEFDKVIVRDLIPFSQGNRDMIKKKFGTESEADYKFNKKVDAEDLLGRNKRLEKENKALEADVQALKDYINANAELSEGKTWNPVDLNLVAKSLTDKSKSDIDLKTLRKQLASTYTYITEQLSSGNESWEDIMDECYAVASDIYDEIKNKPTLSKTRITNEIKKAGVTADEETIAQVQDVVSEASKEDFVRNLAVEVYNGYWKASTLKTSADVMQEKVNKVKSDKTKLKQLNEKQQAKIKQLKFEHRKTMDWMLAEQKKADEIHYGKLIERVREDRDIKLKQLKQYVKDRDARVKDAAERRKLISKIYDVSQTLGKRLLNAEKGRKVPDVLKTPLANLLNAIDFSSQRLLGIKGGKDMFKPTQNDIAMSTLLDKVRMAVDRFNKGEADDDDKNYDFNNLHLPINFAQELDEIKDKLRTVEDAVGERSVYTLQYMTTEELGRLYEAIKAMRTAINNMNKIISTNNAHEVDYLGNEIMEYLDKLGDNKFENAVTNFMTVANKTPFYFFKHLGRGGQELFSFLQNGWDKLADNVEVIRDFTHGKKGEKPLYTADEFEKWKNTVRTYTIYEPTEDGTKERTFSITEAQMMSLYCLSKREQAMSHISQDGVVIDVIKTKRKYGKHDIKMQETVHLIESELARVLADVKNDDRMRTVADKLQEFMNTTCAEWGNEVTQKLYGTDEYTEKNYFPIHVNQDVLASEAKDKSKSIYGMLNQSFTKPLVEGARNEIYVSDIFDVFATHTGDMAKYNALALPIMDVIKVWNYKEQVDIGDEGNRNVKGVKKSITKAIGKAGNAYIGHLLRDLNGDAESGRYDKATMRLMKNYKTAAVAANIQTALLQPLSYIRAGYMVNGKYLRLALLKKPQVKKCLENIGVQKWKALGFYDTNLNIGLDRIISNGNTWMDNFIEKSLWLTEKMDEITWGYLYTAVELETKDKYPTLSGDKLNEVVAKRLRDVLYGTQVFDSTLSRTDMMRSKSTLVQMETAFGAEPILSVNMLMDAVTLFNQEKKQNGKASAMKKYAKLIGRAGLIYLLSSVVESVLRSVLGKLRKYDDDDKDRFEDIQQDILERTLEELDVLNKIPIVKEAMPYIRKFVLSKFGMGKNIYLDNAQMNEEVFNTIYQALNGVYKILDGGEMNYKTFEKIFKAVSEATGLPISNVLKELKTIYNNTIGDATGNMWK